MRVAEVVCLGESMAVFVPAEPGPVERVSQWTRTIGGAESNVACTLARLGVRSAWVSAVGDDPFGRAVVDSVRRAGVDTSGVVVDPTRPTGLYVKTTPVRYYRRGSAAAAMGPDVVERLDLAGTKIVHVSGITAALSPGCLALLRAVMDLPRTSHQVSFDLNWRPALGADPGVLRDLADRADIVLVGADEAEAVWGTTTPAAIRDHLPGPRTIVVKQGDVGATLISGDHRVFVPALKVEVVEPVGAGDAFAAGFLAALLDGHPPARALRAGHLRAATVLCSHHDVTEPLTGPVVADLLDADAETWASVTFTEAGIR
ncbi:sugar kinase [Actinokineospora inagensis]|uniref:sugar kinase n=1 Tax=Actinokineospora inagensis TaxID=103730 RepID=UPI00041D2A0E|nr:sugar kinase [Actinokineospora inagensis]